MKRNVPSNQKQRPYMENYMIESPYSITKNFGIIMRNQDLEVQCMMRYFGDSFTEAQLRDNNQKYNLETMFQLLKKCFLQEYGFDADKIVLDSKFQFSVNSYIMFDETEKAPAFIHVDELFQSTIHSFLRAMLKWSKNFDDEKIYGSCFLHILYLMNDVCIFGDMQEEAANGKLMELLKGDIQILNLAEDCYWTVIAFSMAHELAHAYLNASGMKYSEHHLYKEEFDADMIAYHIVLLLIMSQDKQPDTSFVLEKYTYLAPMMLMDFFDLFYYTDRVLYNSMITTITHPLPGERKKRLFAVVNQDMYDFDTVDGNHLYNGFLDSYDAYRDELLLKMHRGKLNKILRTDRRANMRGDLQ